MADITVEQARDATANAVTRAAERYVSALSKGADPVRFAHVLGQPLPPMVLRVLRSVEESFWRREVARRQRDPRFAYGDPAVREAAEEWDQRLRAAMVLTAKELRQLLGRALSLQMEAITSPVQCMNTSYFAREKSIAIKSAIIIANHLGFEERYMRALTFMAQDDESRALDADDFRRIVRDVDAKEHGGSQDLAAIGSLSHVMLILGLRTDDELGEVPCELAQAFMVLRGTAAGAEKVSQACQGKARIDMAELQGLFASERTADVEPAKSSEEVERFLDELGVDADIIPSGQVTGGKGGVRFVLTDEEKQAYVARAVGRQVHLIGPIMKVIEGALTWEEVDRAINDMLPDNVRDQDLSARSYRSRIG